jgi:MoxR-like ATPase
MTDTRPNTESRAGADTREVEREAQRFRESLGLLREEIGRVIVGQRAVIDGVLTCMLAGSHALLEGVPGLGKTMLVRTLSKALGLSFSRVQFTPDLMPADVIGTTVMEEGQAGSRAFDFQPGPIFAHIVLADEINRATPKTQSALLEAMQERSVTVGRKTHPLDPPHLVLATQNPLEMEGTYPLPEAQLDRFFFKLHVTFPSREELHAILERTTTLAHAEPRTVLSRKDVLEFQELVRKVPVPHHVQDYAVRLLLATRPESKDGPAGVRRFVREGASPRGAQAVLLAAKIRALMEGRFAASLEDVRVSALPALRHRVLLNFEGEAEGIKTDAILEEILKALPQN